MAARTWTHLLIHHSATPPTATVADIELSHLQRGWTGIGYHYVLQRDAKGRGHLKAGRPDTRTGAHAGVGRWNQQALGLCVIGYFHPGSRYSEHLGGVLYDDLVSAIAHLCRTYDIPPAHMMYHRDVKATACPGDWFADKHRLIADVEKALGGTHE